MILKTYARVFTNDAESALATFQALHGAEPHLKFRFGEWDLIGIGDTFIVGGTDAALAPIRDSHGPWIVRDLDEAQRRLEQAGATITQPAAASPTGRFLYARHADGALVEYVEWTPELVEKFIRAPQREGRLSSQL
ncbi:hypothetical protein K32_16660 [Kaistia sp. 32K]|uniref:VOC family protein n=1 Tax=Kaistia sp. 32K TaxID=2795690 RepID=UPI00191592DD|nr:hypothetical protein [Kaistia sp. 32K]BCP53049.1 hypothetical protein K32_16660 [Kaistia sp. 32K]